MTFPTPHDGNHSIEFATTQWSIVAAAGSQDSSAARDALSSLCQRYWPPLYAYARRRMSDANQAQEYTQAFFVSVLEKHTIAAADHERGRFRSFLLTSFKHFIANERQHDRALKRGGDRLHFSLDFDSEEARLSVEPTNNETPESLFERKWALQLLDSVLDSLRVDYKKRGQEQQFEVFKDFLVGRESEGTLVESANKLGVTPGAAKVAVHRLRQRYREALRTGIAQTLAGSEEVDEEIQYLFSVLSQ
ncbi:RNA polymerase sigma factor [Bythopirellula polymerisocia]|uniref:RNA polymerase sigma factor n=1 Tax=Bythopirellula polymerisocia TaxID=2528003 RepID=A0A5C6CK96_9BACT|nr:sigma-70 family RNA polymerase sigma factor [Bythopirellula polymerisocia]TWU23526.1 RNA polymerase sigma factor [Bythopirellula polymerisocia]